MDERRKCCRNIKSSRQVLKEEIYKVDNEAFCWTIKSFNYG
jgi:hypothetical protein